MEPPHQEAVPCNLVWFPSLLLRWMWDRLYGELGNPDSPESRRLPEQNQPRHTVPGAETSPLLLLSKQRSESSFTHTAYPWSHQHLAEKHVFLISIRPCLPICTTEQCGLAVGSQGLLIPLFHWRSVYFCKGAIVSLMASPNHLESFILNKQQTYEPLLT